METLTIAEAAERTGTSPKAIARRIERGTLQAIVRDGKRRLPLTELEKLPRGTTETAPAGQGNHGAAPPDIAPLIQRLEQLAAENMRLRLLTEQTESGDEELRNELHQARARIKQLESARRKRWFRRSEPF
jgi:excisionase family DNA binding protein